MAIHLAKYLELSVENIFKIEEQLRQEKEIR